MKQLDWEAIFTSDSSVFNEKVFSWFSCKPAEKCLDDISVGLELLTLREMIEILKF